MKKVRVYEKPGSNSHAGDEEYQYRYCQITHDAIMVLCCDCYELHCFSCYQQDHHSHNVMYIKDANSLKIEGILEEKCKEMHKERLRILDEKLSEIRERHEKCDKYQEAGIKLNKFKNSFLADLEKVFTDSLQMLHSKIEGNEMIIENTVNCIKQRESDENKNSQELHDFVDSTKEPFLKYHWLGKYIFAVKSKMERDRSIKIQEFPEKISEFSEIYKSLIKSFWMQTKDSFVEIVRILEGQCEDVSKFENEVRDLFVEMGQRVEKHCASNFDIEEAEENLESSRTTNKSIVHEETQILEKPRLSNVENEEMEKKFESSGMPNKSFAHKNPRYPKRK